MDLEFVDIDTKDPYRWHRTVFCKDLLCISDEEGPEASVSNHKTRNRNLGLGKLLQTANQIRNV